MWVQRNHRERAKQVAKIFDDIGKARNRKFKPKIDTIQLPIVYT